MRIAHAKQRRAAEASKQVGRNSRSDHTPVKGHSAFPNGEQPRRVLGENLRHIEDHVAQTPPHDDTERDEAHEIPCRGRREGRCVLWPIPGAAQVPTCSPGAEQETRDIGERIPTYFDRPERHGHRIDDRERKSRKHRRLESACGRRSGQTRLVRSHARKALTMTRNGPLLDDFAKLMTNAAGFAQGVPARGRDRYGGPP